MKNRLVLGISIMMLLSIMALSGCSREHANDIAKEEADISEEALPWKIAIITNSLEGGDEEGYRSAEALAAMFGEDRLMHRTAFLSFGWFDWSPIIQEIAEDLEIRAVVVSTLDFFLDRDGLLSAPIDELLDMRDDIFLVYTGPTDYPLNPASAAERSNLVIGTNYQMVGEGFVMQAIAMGAETIAHYSFPRHVVYTPFIAERRDTMRATAEREGIRFVELAALDPMEVNGTAYAMAHIEQDLPKQVEELGVNTAFFGTSCVLQASILSQVMATGAIFVQPCCLSPYDGYPVGLGIEYRVYTGAYADWRTPITRLIELPELIEAIDGAVEVGGMSGRISGWAVPSSTMWMTIGLMYAVEWILGNVPQEYGIICLDTLEGLAREYTARLGFDSGVSLEFYDTTLRHFVLGTVEYRMFGDR